MNRVGLITMAPFPIGNVTTLRYTSYMEALANQGKFVKVYIYTPTRMAAKIRSKAGVYKNIEYEYTSEITLKKRNLITQTIALVKGLLRSAVLIRKDRIDTLIINEDHLLIVHAFYKLLSVIYDINIFWEKTEYPKQSIRASKYQLTVYTRIAKWYQGMIVITKELQSYFSRIRRDGKILLLPMTIDPNRYSSASQNLEYDDYIAIVFGVHNRDGLKESIASYVAYKQKGGRYDLRLIGDFGNMPNKIELENVIMSSEYKNNIHIMGLVPNNDVPAYLQNASCLLTTPNYYISGGFPTKLGEYMLSGVPIVATIAGELLDYITPNEEVLFSKPGDIDDISNNLLFVEQNRDISLQMALNAKKKALHVFNANTYSSQIIKFLSNS